MGVTPLQPNRVIKEGRPSAGRGSEETWAAIALGLVLIMSLVSLVYVWVMLVLAGS